MSLRYCCVIRISKILLYAIHNYEVHILVLLDVVLSGFQRYFCMQYTTMTLSISIAMSLCYQDFKDTFVCNTQLSKRAQRRTARCVIRISKILLYAIHNILPTNKRTLMVVLSGFQRYFCMQYTTDMGERSITAQLCYQDFKDTFVCNTQPCSSSFVTLSVVLSGFQRYFCMQYTTDGTGRHERQKLCYQDFKDTFVCNTQRQCVCSPFVPVVLSGFQRYFCMQYTT